MAQSSVNVAERPDLPRQVERRTLSVEILSPVEDLHRRFDEAYDRAEAIAHLIQVRRSRGLDCTEMFASLKEAEAEKKAALATLRKARWLKVVPAA